MSSKIIGYYSDFLEQPDNDRLTIEIGKYHLACVLRDTAGAISGFELFSIEEIPANWHGVFSSIQSSSRILTRSYPHTRCYYNTGESLVIPAEKFSLSSAEDYLSLVYGKDSDADTKHETLHNNTMVNAYRVPRQLYESIGRHFVLYQPHHIDTAILNEIQSQAALPAHYLRLQFYPKHFILVYVKAGRLQLIRHFPYASPLDVQYHLSNAAQQLHIPASEAIVEISGMIAADAVPRYFLYSLFNRVEFDSFTGDEALLSATAEHPAHYFTPFYKLPS